ncbi:MAG: flagellar biosynthesis protein FlhF [Pseudomonadota bacterium]
MQVKKFEAVDMAEALELVKRQLGSDAVILSTRKVKRGGGVFGILGRQTVEVTAAADPDAASRDLRGLVRKREDYDYTKTNLLLRPLEKEIRDLKGMVWSLTRNNLPQMISQLPENLSCLYGQIVGSGVEEGLALNMVKEIGETLSEGEVQMDERVRDCLYSILKRLVRVSGPLKVSDGRRQVVAFVGPTGVGKTTTIAKIAAKQVLEDKRKVALITLDTYRIAAIEQLKIYARIIGVPVEVVLHGNEIQGILEAHRDKDIILVDTAGRSQKSQSQMSELAAFFDTTVPIETHLVLCATTKQEDLDDIYDRFKVVPIDRLLFTKLDESSTFGTLLNQAIRSKVPLSYFTTGQKVPEDIEVATRERILELILKGNSGVERENERS